MTKSSNSEGCVGKSTMKLLPNPKRAELRKELVDVRIRGRAARNAFKVTGLQIHRDARKHYRQLERNLCDELALTPTHISAENGEEVDVIPKGHFARFRHSSRLQRFTKAWDPIKKRGVWKLK